MSRWFHLLAGVVSVVFVLSACSGSFSPGAGSEEDVEIPEGATEVVMWNLFGGGDAEYMQAIVDKFNESQSDVFVNNVMQEFDEYYTKLLTSVAAGKGPDLAIAHSHVLPELVNEGLLMELDDYASKTGMDFADFNQNVLDVTVYDGKHYAVPIDTHPQIMYINNDLVRDAGLLSDDGSVEMEESPEGFVKFLTTLKEELPEDKMAFAFSSVGEDPYRIWWALYTQMGGEHLLSEDLENPDYVLDEEKAIQAANYIKDLYHEHEVIPLNLADFYSDFQSGQAAVMSTGVWATGIWEKTEDLDFTAMPFPNMYEREGAWANSHTFILPYYADADEEKQQAAVEFMNFATENGLMWAEAGHIPAKDTVVESDEFNEMPYRSEYAEVANYVNFADRTIYARGVQEIVIRNLDLIWSNKVTAEEAFATIEQEVTELIGK